VKIDFTQAFKEFMAERVPVKGDICYFKMNPIHGTPWSWVYRVERVDADGTLHGWGPVCGNFTCDVSQYGRHANPEDCTDPVEEALFDLKRDWP